MVIERERVALFFSHPLTLAVILLVIAAIPRAILILQFSPLTYSDSATYELPALIFEEKGFFDCLVRLPLYPIFLIFLGLVYTSTGVSQFTVIIIQHVIVLIAILLVYMNLCIFFGNNLAVAFTSLLRLSREPKYWIVAVIAILTAGLSLTRPISYLYGFIALIFVIMIFRHRLRSAIQSACIFICLAVIPFGSWALIQGEGLGAGGEVSGTFGVTFIEHTRPLLLLNQGKYLEYKMLYRQLAADGKEPV